MNKKQAKERIAEFARICQHAENDEKVLLEVALFVEDVFGIVLSDNEICKGNLGNNHAMEKFILKKNVWKGISAMCSLRLYGMLSVRFCAQPLPHE